MFTLIRQYDKQTGFKKYINILKSFLPHLHAQNIFPGKRRCTDFVTGDCLKQKPMSFLTGYESISYSDISEVSGSTVSGSTVSPINSE